ncbi:MAG: hypothetical protein EOO75_05100 [Myxococcales bacterium]|nr:MAG: hypothetical protein EOO75_05100 [Myxococcales bacterium]
MLAGRPAFVRDVDEAGALAQFAGAIEQQSDPFAAVRGARRLAYRSPLDGHPSTFALYAPARLEPGKRYPLVVALHGLNGRPMNMLRWAFGRDDPGHDGEWEDRHPGDFPDYPAFVVAPMAHFNSMYRHAAEDDVMAVTDWVSRTFPVDPRKVSITGPSMGGTGTAWVGLRFADRFAAAAPLCGYHFNYFLRAPGEFARLHPWEQHQAEERSTVSWAPNGLHLPLYIVHGTRDLPEENSGVLIDRYKQLGYGLLEEHPDEGHNVWQPTYENLKGLGWLTGPTRPSDPNRVVLRTDSLRYDHADWVRIARLERSSAWGEVSAQRRTRGAGRAYEVRTAGVAAFELTPPTSGSSIQVTVDGARIELADGEPMAFERRAGRWERGLTPPGPGLHKRARLAGPLRDVHHEPLVLVYGTADPALTRANEQVARWFGSIRPGFEIDYPVVADTALTDEMARGKALVLVGGAQSNLVTRRLDDRLPIHVTTSPRRVQAGARTFTGDELGAAFVFPNPEQPDRYVVVLAGADVAGTLRAMSLPDFLPDFVVYDRSLAPARGQMVLGRATPLAAGLFDEHWTLPSP